MWWCWEWYWFVWLLWWLYCWCCGFGVVGLCVGGLVLGDGVWFILYCVVVLCLCIVWWFWLWSDVYWFWCNVLGLCWGGVLDFNCCVWVYCVLVVLWCVFICDGNWVIVGWMVLVMLVFFCCGLVVLVFMCVIVCVE